jgi:DNA-binding transcriptional MerR regulator
MSEPDNWFIQEQSRLIAYYSEPEITEYSGLEVQMIRQLAEDEVIGSIQVAGEECRYSAATLALLRRVRRLYYDLGLSLEGIEIILRLIARVEVLQRELAEHHGMADPHTPQ